MEQKAHHLMLLVYVHESLCCLDYNMICQCKTSNMRLDDVQLRETLHYNMKSFKSMQTTLAIGSFMNGHLHNYY